MKVTCVKIVLFLFCGGLVSRGATYLQAYNDSPSVTYHHKKVLYNDAGYSSQYGSVTFGNIAAGASSGTFYGSDCGFDCGKYLRDEWRAAGGSGSVLQYVPLGLYSGGPFTDRYNDSGFTNKIGAALSVTNTGGWFDGSYRVQWYTNANGGTPTLARDDYYILNPGDAFDIPATTNLFGTGINWNYVISAPGTIANDFVPVVAGAGSSSDQVSAVGGSGGTVGALNENDTFNTLPAYNPTGSATNQIVADRQNAQGIAEAVRDIGAALGRKLDMQATNASGGTNSDYSGVLERIRTNTLWSAEQLQSGTNMLGTLTNFAHASTNAMSATNHFLTQLASATNQSVTAWLSGAGESSLVGWSNVVSSYSSSWTSSVSSGSGNPLRVTLPGRPGFVFDLEAPYAGALADELFGAAGWLQDILIGVILFAAFWVSYDMLMTRLFELQQGLTTASKFGGLSGSMFGVFLGAFIKVSIIEIVSLIIVYLPAIAVGFMDSWSWAPLGEGLAGKVNSGVSGESAMTNAMQRFYSMLSNWIPWTTLWVTVVNFLVFRLLLDRVANIAWAMIRGLGVAMSIALLIVGGEVQAASVSVQNHSSGAVTISNGVEQVTFVSGHSLMELNEGVWDFGTNSFELLETGSFDPVPVIRFAGNVDTNGPPVLVSVYEAPSVEMGFWWGWGSGLAVFGFAWLVSAVKMGLTIAYRDHGGT